MVALQIHRLGDPAVTGRHRGLHQHAHRDLGGVARRDRVHGMQMQMVVDEETTVRYTCAG
jgi:hypothetical protein